MPERPPVELITIDLDDTLWPCRPPIERAEIACHAWLAVAAPALAERYDRARLREYRRALVLECPEIAHDVTRVRRESLRRLLREFGYDPELADGALEVFAEHRNRVEPYADVIPALERLRARHCLIALTNGNADVARTPLGPLFDDAFTAGDVGARKPDPAMFQAAWERAGVGPERALHVGDDPLLDIDGARRVGMATYWMNRDGRDWPDGLVPADAEASNLDALGQWLEQSGAL